MKHRNNHFAVGYWSLIRRGRPAPDQADVDPKALKRLLPFVFLLDARHSTFVYRLAGTTLCERYDRGLPDDGNRDSADADDVQCRRARAFPRRVAGVNRLGADNEPQRRLRTA